MINTVEAYLNLLKKELSGSDAATIRDALSDAEEYLCTALENAKQAQPGLQDVDALPAIIEEFGSPDEIASAYKAIEHRLQPGLSPSTHARSGRSPIISFFAVLVDPGAWGALLYMILSLVTGIVYFTWAVTGLSLSLGLLVLIIGLPFIAFFLLSARGIALVEGRIVEALLGVRMPHRPVFIDRNLKWKERFKILVTGKLTWLSILYMILMLPLGVIYFSLFITLISVALSLVAFPIAQAVLQIPLVTIHDNLFFLPAAWMPVVVAAGFLIAVVTMHLAKVIGRLHGILAKAMLVSE
jgi:hypothetical protein